MPETADSLRRRLGALTSEQVAALDGAAVRLGVGIVQLMEVAGFQVARAAWRRLGHRPGRVAVLAGRGNNGGDGLVAARHLEAWGCTVRSVVVGDQARLQEAPRRQLAALSAGGARVEVTDDPLAARRAVHGADLVIDAILGTGLRSAPRAPDSGVIEGLDGVDAALLSVDVPSGLDGADGTAAGACVSAGLTCTLTAMKAGLWTASGRAHAGAIVVADIGMPAAAWHACGLSAPTDVVGGALVEVPVAPGS